MSGPVEGLLNELGIEIVRAEGQGHLLCVCHECQTRHLYINRDNGLWDCKKGCGSGNAFELVRKITGKKDKHCFELLDRFGLNNAGNSGRKASPRDLSWFTCRLVQADRQVLKRFCRLKSISYDSLAKFGPMVHKTDPIVALPAYNRAGKVCGYLRAGINGQPIKLKGGKQEKYPAIGSHGLCGLPWLLNEKPQRILFCEGWRDALAAVEAGFHATASTGGASTFKASWLELFSGKEVYIIMDADKAGQKAAKRAADKIVCVAEKAYIVKLPYEVRADHGGDLHDYLVRDGGDMDQLLAGALRYEPEDSLDVIRLKNDHPDTIAEAIDKYCRQRLKIIHRYNSVDGWSRYVKDRYHKVEDEKEIEILIRRCLRRCCIKARQKQDDGKVEIVYKPFKKKSHSFVKDIREFWLSLDGVYISPENRAPCSLNGKLDPDRTIALENGLLDLRNAGNPVLHPHTRQFYTFNYLPYSYAPQAQCPTWDWALGQYFQNEDGSADELVPDILHSWMKKWLLRDTSHQKIFVLLGRRRSGKGTIGRVINRLIGENNIVPLTISAIAKNFGLQPLINKQLGIMWDASIGAKNSTTREAVEILKSISGEDRFTIDRKHKEQLANVKLPLSILMIANKMVDLRDSTGALAGRFTYLETTGSFYGGEDPTIEDKLCEELPGIFNRVIAAPQGRVMDHPNSSAIQQSFEELSSPYIAFINDWCDVDPDNFIPADVLWAYYCQWAKRNNHHQPSPQKFKIEFHGAHDEIKKDYRPRLNQEHIYQLQSEYGLDSGPADLDQDLDHGLKSGLKITNRPYCYKGIDLKDEFKSG